MTVNSTYPGVYLEEVPSGIHPIPGVSTSRAAFVDFFAIGPLHQATSVASFDEFTQVFGGLDARSEASYAVQQFFLNGGSHASVVRVCAAHEPTTVEWKNSAGAEAILGSADEASGIYALRGTGFNLLCLPAAAHLCASSLKRVYDAAMQFCNAERAFLIVDIPPDVDTPTKVIHWLDATNPDAITRDKNAAVYFPRLLVPDPLDHGLPRNGGASGTIAGLYARTDAEQGVWQASAGEKATLHGVTLAATISDRDNAEINPFAINALRNFPIYGNVCWGARTLAGSDADASEWKYIPIRRLTLFIEESIYRGTLWVVFEPNDEPLWAMIRLQVGAFMQSLFRQGALQGATPKDAYFVQCDRTTTTQDDLDRGVVNVDIGFAPLRPAEFVVIRIQQLTRRVRRCPRAMPLSSDLLRQFARRQSIGSNEPGVTPLIASADQDEFAGLALSDSAELNDILERAINFALPNPGSTAEVSFLSLSASLESILTFHRRQDEYKIFPSEDFTELERDLKKWLKQHRVLALEPAKRALVYEKFRELNRFPMSHVFNMFCESYSLDLSDLWPVIGEHAKWPLTEIRHRLVHGDPFRSRPAEAIECAEKHLRWVVERMLLCVLGWPIARSSVSRESLENASVEHSGWRIERAKFA